LCPKVSVYKGFCNIKRFLIQQISFSSGTPDFSKISYFLTKRLPLVYPRFTPKSKNAMLTIRAEVLKDKKRTDGTYNVKVRFTKDLIASS
jgi:hypothetical protein